MEEGGITAFYQVEMGVNTDESTDAVTQRFAAAGIKGDFGKVVYGRTSTGYKMSGLKSDPFYDTSAGGGFGGANYGLSPLSNGWTDNSLAYSNSFGEFKVNAAVYMDDSTEDNHDFNIGGAYATDELTVGLQVLVVGETGVIANSVADSTAWRLHGKFSSGPITLRGSFEQIDVDGADDAATFLYLSGEYELDEKARVAASFGYVDKVSDLVDGMGITAGYFRTLAKNTELSSLISIIEPDEDVGAEVTTVSVGFSHKFSIGG